MNRTKNHVFRFSFAPSRDSSFRKKTAMNTEEISAIVVDAELAGLEQRREKTRALKQAMMQELLTGRTRLVSREAAKNAKEQK